MTDYKRNMGSFTARHPIAMSTLCFITGVALATVVWFFAWRYYLLPALVAEAELQIAKGTIVTLSKMDKRCLEWRERADGWMCVRR